MKDYLSDKGIDKTVWIHKECNSPIYQTNRLEIGVCGHCAAILDLSCQPERSKREDTFVFKRFPNLEEGLDKETVLACMKEAYKDCK